MEKAGIFCDNCPIRTRTSFHKAEQPIGLDAVSEPVSRTLARHHTGVVEAVRYRTVTESGELSPDASVLVPADISVEAANKYFINCDAPTKHEATIGIKRLSLHIPLGRSCTALAAIEYDAVYQSKS